MCTVLFPIHKYGDLISIPSNMLGFEFMFQIFTTFPLFILPCDRKKSWWFGKIDVCFNYFKTLMSHGLF